MVKKKEQMTNEEREKMLVRLADMRQKVADNRKAKAEAGGGAETKPNIEIFGNAKIEIKKPVPKKPDELMLEKLDRVASHLEELTTYKKEKVAAKKAKEQQEQKIKEEVKPPPTPAVVATPTFQFPKSHGNPFFQGGRF